MDLVAVRRAVFARHSHPLSAWTRWATTPLLLAPIWTRRPTVAAAVAAWFAVNPIITPPPRHQRAFATRAMLGEEAWTADPKPDRLLIAVNVLGSAFLLSALVTARHRRRGLPAVGVAASMALTMYGWRRYAAIYDSEQ